MVRLETPSTAEKTKAGTLIYIPVWLDQKPDRQYTERKRFNKFTFQYGQIRNFYKKTYSKYLSEIYIPVWLDQKLDRSRKRIGSYKNLHSSMVRLETPFV